MSIPSPEPLRALGFSMLEMDLKFLMEAFGAMLNKIGEPELAAALPWIGTQQASGISDRKLGQVYSMAFQLLNIVEERTAAHVRRLRETQRGAEAEKGLWPDNLRTMKDAGLGPDEILNVLKHVSVEPVLTAHPTESKRETARERHREIYRLMQQRDNAAYTPREKERIRSQIEVQMESLWRTGEIHVTRPTIDAELKNALHYLREIFPGALQRSHVHLAEAWKAAGNDVAALDDLPPLVRFGNWIGGDRDGHPFVTADVTQSSLREMRLNALRVHRRSLESLADEVPLSQLFQEPPAALKEMIAKLSSELQGQPGVDVGYIEERNREEPWRNAAYLMRAKVMLAMDHPSSPAAYTSPEQLGADLALFGETLAAAGAGAIVSERVVPFRRQIAAFGFHGADLDVRQNSAFHEKAMSQLLVAAGIENGASFADWSLAEKRALLEKELTSPRPFLAPGMTAGSEADTVLACHRVLAEHRSKHGNAGLGALIVSMTCSVEDLLTVYLIAREAGLMELTPEGLRCPLPVTPLFETMDDLEVGPAITAEFLSHPVTKRSLAGVERPEFQMMIGYSDSNKDCGIMASQWALHRGQSALSKATLDLGVQPVFFHGRGGTVGRGAGPTHWFMEALPGGSLTGRMRMTEQGETIEQKYAHMASAVYHLELLMASASATTARHLHMKAPQENIAPVMDKLALWSSETYRALLHAPDFMTFYRQATPIDALENARIGSRPSRRTGQASLADLRAIPWVFSWTQSRFFLPGWYGVGSALEKLKTEDPAGFAKLRDELPKNAFLRYVLTNVESSIVSANKEWMKRYASLVAEETVRTQFLDLILGEFNRTESMVNELFQGTFADRRPRLAFTLNIREQPLTFLHEQQIQLLKTWRGKSGNDSAEAMLPDVLVSVNALASGLRTTG